MFLNVCNNWLNRRLNKSYPILQSLKSKTTWEANKDYQYIQRSKLPTMHFQPSLPRLPIPKLEQTCMKYLNAQKPVLTDAKFTETSSIVTEFLKTDGPVLQEELITRNKKNSHTSYISEFWFDMYLCDRKPLPINFNPYLIFNPESNPEYNSQLVKATNLILSAGRFMKSLRENILEPEVYHLSPQKSDTKLFRQITGLLPSNLSWYGAYLFKAFPLDMSQYSNLFNSTRIPELKKDRIYQNTSMRHIVVLRKGHFYELNILDENYNLHSPQKIAAGIKYILQDDTLTNEYPIGILTTCERNEWATIRSHLLNIGNENALEKIDSASFVLVLDDVSINDNQENLLRLFLHSDGTNRWFDKSFSLIISNDGYAGINFEHSWGDGVAVLRFFQDVKKDITSNPLFHPHETGLIKENSECRKIEFKLDSKVQDSIKRAQKEYKKWTEELDISFFIRQGFGKTECKKLGVSPDAMMQLAFQLAFYHIEGRMVPTYESCSTAAFKHGRTETIRPCTVQTKAVCEALTKKHLVITAEEIKKMIIGCSNAHGILTKDAAMGQGFDRHLFALKTIWEQNRSNINKLNIYKDPAYDNLNHNILSTSTLSSPAVLAGGFGPVVHDGYGIGYMIQNDQLGTVITSYKSKRSSSDYVESLESAFNKIYKALANT